MNFALKVVVGLLVMGVLDIPMIKFVISPLLSRYARELVAQKPDGIAALIFYVGYVSLAIFLSHRHATDLREVAVNGALLGALAYGTYEFTNKAVINGWPWQMVAVDFMWGITLTSAVVSITYLVFSK